MNKFVAKNSFNALRLDWRGIGFVFLILMMFLLSGVTTSVLSDEGLIKPDQNYKNSRAGGGTIWTVVEEIEHLIEINKCSDNFIKISTGNNVSKRLSIRKELDPVEFLSNTAKTAVDQTPNWLRDDLTEKFIELSNQRMDLGDDANIAFGDLDGDGDQDMVAGSQENELRYFKNCGTQFEPIFLEDESAIYPYWEGSEENEFVSSDPDFGDLDLDGDLDIIFGNRNGDISLLINQGNKNTPKFNYMQTTVGVLNGYSSPCLGDLDNDGDLDVISGADNGRIYFFRNNGDNDTYFWLNRAAQVEMIDVGSRSKPSLADLDDDGDLDLTIGEEQAILNYYENTGNPRNPIWRYDSQAYIGLIVLTQTSPSIADLNGDRRFDLFVGSTTGQIQNYYNMGTSMNPVWEYSGSYKVFPGIEYYDPIRYLKVIDHNILDSFAELIVQTKNNYKDEVAFSIAHTSPQVLNDPNTNPEVYNRNVELLYEIDQYIEYADIVDYGAYPNDDYYSTVRYKYKEKNSTQTLTTELPIDIYYWYIVHPKITDEIPAYINPTTGDPTQPPIGVFWREYLFYHNDTEYPEDPPTDPDENGIPNFHYPKEESPPLLKEKLAGIEHMYDSQPYNAPRGYDNQGYNNSRPWGYKDHAIEAVSNWVAKTLPLNEQESADGERPIQPVRIAHHHNGNCGELQDLSIAAARTALIPAAGVLLLAEDHVWNEFYDRGWHQWDNYWSDGGSVVDNFMNYWVGWNQRGGSGLTKWHGDDSTTDVTSFYVPEEDLSTITVTVHGRYGNPVDGARVMMGSHWLTGQASGYQVSLPYPSVWNYTDTNGSCTFRVATQEGMPDGNQNFSFKVISKLGNAERPRTQLEHGQDYEFKFILDGYFEEGELLDRSHTVEDPPERFMVMAYWEELSATQKPPNPMVGNSHPESVTLGRDVKFYLFNESNFNYYCKSMYLENEYVQCIRIENSNSQQEIAHAYQLLDNNDWYLVGYHKNSVETTKNVKLRLVLYEMKDEIPFVRIDKPVRGSVYEVGETVEFSGVATDDRGIETLILRFNEIKIDITEHLVDDIWNYQLVTSNMAPGNYTFMVYAEDSNGHGFGVYTKIVLKPAPPPDTSPPVIVISSPENGSQYIIGNTVQFQGMAWDDSYKELCSLTIKIGLKTVDILNSLVDKTWSYTWDSTEQTAGTYKFNLIGKDKAGNIGRAFGNFELVEEEKDYDPPTVTIDNPATGESFGLGSKVFIKGTVYDNVGVSEFKINIDYQGWIDITDKIIRQTFTYTWDSKMAHAEAGEHIIAVQASDKMGNVEEIYTIISLVDIDPPEITISSPASGEIIKAGDTIEITGAIEDDMGVNKLELTISRSGSSDTIKRGIDIFENDWSYTWEIPPNKPSGTYTITAKATDYYDNTETTSITVVVEGRSKTKEESGIWNIPSFDLILLIMVVLSMMVFYKRRSLIY